MAHILKTKRMSGKRSEAATGQARRMLDVMEDFRNEEIAKHKKRMGQSTHAIHVGTGSERWIYRNGKRIVVRLR